MRTKTHWNGNWCVPSLDSPTRTGSYTRLAFWLSLVVAVGSSVFVYNGWRVVLNKDQYRREVFIVDRVDYIPRSGGDAPIWYATGTIREAPEKFSLVDSVPEPSGSSELSMQFPAGTRIDVWYDPTAFRDATQGRYLRVLPGHSDMERALSNAIVRTACFDGPLIVVTLLMLLSAWRARKQTTSRSLA